MKTFYSVITILLVSFVAFALPYDIKIDSTGISVVAVEKPAEKETPPSKKHKKSAKSTNRANQTTALLPPSISVVKSVSVNGGGNATPGSQLNYSILLSNAGTDATAVVLTDVLNSNLTLVAGSVKASPIAVADAYTSIGNVGITVPAANGVITNDVNPIAANTLTITTFDATSVGGGAVTMTTSGANIGAFTYTPAAGYNGTDTFTYTIDNGSGITNSSRTATVTITVSTPIWFVNIAAASNGSGTLQSPFKDWSNFSTENVGGAGKPDINHIIFVYSGTYSGTAALRNGQKVIGQGSTSNLVTFAGGVAQTYTNTLPTTGGTNPNLTSLGTTITLGSGNTLTGFSMGNSVKDIAGSSFGTLTATQLTLDGNGQALDLTTGTLAVTFASISSTNSAVDAISLNGITGSLISSGGVSVTNPTSSGIKITGNSTVTSNFGNTVINGSGSTGVLLSSTDNISTTFGSLDIAPDANQNCIQGSGNAGTLTCTSGTFTNTGGLNVNLRGVNSGTKLNLNVTLTSITSSGGTQGVFLENTSGNFTVTGTGTTAGSGGSISNISLRGVQFTNASNITLKNMNFTNANTTAGTLPTQTDNSGANAALYFNAVTGITLDNIQMNAAVGNANAQNGINLFNCSNFNLANSTITRSGFSNSDYACLYAINTTGTNTITNSTLSKAARIARFTNNSGTMTLRITSSNFNDTRTNPDNNTLNAFGQAGLLFEGYGTSQMTLDVKSSCNFLRCATQGIDAYANGNSIIQADVQNSTFNANNASLATGEDVGTATDFAAFNNGTVKFNILNNTIAGRAANLINLYTAPASAANVEGTVEGNTLTYSFKPTINNNAGSGIRLNHNSSNTTTRIRINNNTLRNFGGGSLPIDVLVNGTTGRADVICTNNTIIMGTANYGPANDQTPANYGIRVNAAQTDQTVTVCSKTANNLIYNDLNVGSSPGGGALGLAQFRAAFGGNIHLFEGNNAGNTTPIGMLNIWNNAGNLPTATGVLGGGGNVLSVGVGGGGTLTYGATCVAPNVPLVNLSIPDRELAVNQDSANARIAANQPEQTTRTDSAEVVKILTIEPEKPQSFTAEKATQYSTASTQAGETVTINGAGSGFNLPATKSTTVTFSATISNTPSTCAITNRASVSGTGFTTVNSNTTTTNVIIAPPTALTTATAICAGQSVSLTATCAAGTVNWYRSTSQSTLLGNTASGANFVQAPTENTIYTAKCLIGGCESAGSNTGLITVNALPTITVGASPAICVGASSFTIPYTATTGTPTTYSISGTGITTVTNASLTASPITVNLSSAAAGINGSSYVYNLTVRNANNCTSDNIAGSVTVNSTPAPTNPTATPSIIITSGNTTTLTASGCNSPSTITWYDSSNPNVALPNNTPAITANKTFFARCTGTNTCLSAASTTVSVTYNPCDPMATAQANVDLVWTGAISTDWNNGCNWSPSGIPTATNNVTIPSTPTNQPTLSVLTGVAKSVEVQSGATFNVSSSGQLTINNFKDFNGQTSAFLNNGTVQNSGKVILGNTAAIGSTGLWNQSIFNNNAGGEITVDRSTGSGILNQQGTFTNAARITIGANATVGDKGLENQATFNNSNCGEVNVRRGKINVTSGKTYTNTGFTFVVSELQNDGMFTNNGVLKYGTTTGNAVVNTAISSVIVKDTPTPIFVYGGTYNGIVNGIFTDTTVLASAGSYNAVSNVFTPNGSVPAGSRKLYAKITQNGCATAVSVPFIYCNITLTAGISTNPTTCNGTEGSIAFTTNLPNGNYTLNYIKGSTPTTAPIIVASNAFTLSGLTAGNYNGFSITDNGCTGSDASSKILSDPATPTLTAGAVTNPTTCGGTGSIAFTTTNLANGTYTLTYTGTGSPKTITVASNAFVLSGLTAGNYSGFSITNNGCTGTDGSTKTLVDPTTPTLTAGTVTNPTTCNGTDGSIPFTTSLTNGSYTLNYTKGVTATTASIAVVSGAFSLSNLGAGNYANFSITVLGCTAIDASTKTLSDPATPVVVASFDEPTCAGQSLQLRATVTGATGTITYNWSGPGGFTSSQANPLVVNPAAGSYTVDVLAAGCTATSTTSAVVFIQPITFKNRRPAFFNEVYGCENGSIKLGSGATGAFSYQWQIKNGATFENLTNNPPYSNVTSDSLTINPVALGLNNQQYRVLLSTACQSNVVSDTITLKVGQLPVLVTSPLTQEVCPNNEVQLTANFTGGGFSYQWQVNTGSGFVNVSGPDYQSLNNRLIISNFDNAKNNSQYRAVAKSSCFEIPSNAATITINTDVTILAQPNSQTVCEFNTAIFTAQAVKLSAGTLNYQWQRKSGAEWVNVNTGDRYVVNGNQLTINNVPAEWNDAEFRCLINGYCQTIPKTLFVTPVAHITQNPQPVEICSGNNAVFSVTAAGQGLTYRWQVNTGSGFTNLNNGGVYQGVTAANLLLSFPNSSLNGYQYRCIVSGNSTCDLVADTSAVATLSIGVSAEAQTVFYNSPITTNDGVTQAVSYILGINKIQQPNGKAEYRAGNAILLNPGFEVEQGAVFTAVIRNPCQTNIVNSNEPKIPKEKVK